MRIQCNPKGDYLNKHEVGCHLGGLVEVNLNILYRCFLTNCRVCSGFWLF